MRATIHQTAAFASDTATDYIPGLGDTISCCIVGAAWTKERGRELRGRLGSSWYRICVGTSELIRCTHLFALTISPQYLLYYVLHWPAGECQRSRGEQV